MVNYTAAQELALEKFRANSLEVISHYSRYPLVGNALSIDFLGGQYILDYPSGIFKTVNSLEKELSIPTQILILHYLANIAEVEETGRLISFKELPGGSIYIQPFTHRAIDPLVRFFGDKPDKLKAVVSHLGGYANSLGDVGVTIRAFPRVPVTLILWRGDDEFPASGNILFDSSASLMLPTEDYAVLASAIVARLKGLSSMI
ncbi:DUF3786 domain-containing protein [Desulfosporosinus sp. FKA]|uniref:DUF3786 domain-containing protein n=1 Tax=Desulfosporosinus sp. FKA TaxID=1969834 RepID=UPI000B4A53AE|nr:DUF3786 domain-containing protein [Desulfosporosinus sp. FKA]